MRRQHSEDGHASPRTYARPGVSSRRSRLVRGWSLSKGIPQAHRRKQVGTRARELGLGGQAAAELQRLASFCCLSLSAALRQRSGQPFSRADGPGTSTRSIIGPDSSCRPGCAQANVEPIGARLPSEPVTCGLAPPPGTTGRAVSTTGRDGHARKLLTTSAREVRLRPAAGLANAG